MDSVPSSLAPPVLLRECLDPSAFNSGEPVLDDWLRQCAWKTRLVIIQAISPAAEALYPHDGFTRQPDTPTSALDLVKFQKPGFR